MNLPIPVFFISTVIFVIILAVKREKQTRNQQNTNEAFIERERQANITRKKDISNLNYLSFSTEALPFGTYTDEKLSSCEEILKNLAGKKIINLSQYSNTDLKLMYGPANLNDLSEYDDNYHKLSAALLDYADRETELEQYDAAIAVLEYAMKLRIDSSKVYLTLAKLYQKQHMPEKIREIANAVSSMDTSFASYVLPKLNTYDTDE